MPGDELRLVVPTSAKGAIQAVRSQFPTIDGWEIIGFEQPDKVNVRPILLAAKELPGETDLAVTKIVDKGWVVAVNVLFSISGVQVIRRDALGRERWISAAHLPVCWSPENPLFEHRFAV